MSFIQYIRPMTRRSAVVAVLTGDVVGSSTIKDRRQLNATLKKLFKQLRKHVPGTVREMEIYRGDSFQGVMAPEHVLRSALVIRAGLRQWDLPKGGSVRKGTTMGRLPDARIAIGIGTVSYRSAKVIESDGEAFRSSGRALDRLSGTKARLSIQTPWPEVNDELEVVSKLLDALIGRWSPAASQAVLLSLLTDATQVEVSKKLGISQPAVHKRLGTASLDAVKAALGRFEKLVQSHTAA